MDDIILHGWTNIWSFAYKLNEGWRHDVRCDTVFLSEIITMMRATCMRTANLQSVFQFSYFHNAPALVNPRTTNVAIVVWISSSEGCLQSLRRLPLELIKALKCSPANKQLIFYTHFSPRDWKMKSEVSHWIRNMKINPEQMRARDRSIHKWFFDCGKINIWCT